MEQFIKQYGRLVCKDGGPWYHQALKWLSGGFRNYLEGWFLTLKQLISRFNKYFPCGKKVRTHIQNWLTLYTYYYNNIRIHETLKMPPAKWEALS